MSYEQKDGQGSLFKNTEKETEQHPDYKGSITIAGVPHWLSAWIKTSAKGGKYMSLSAQPKKAAPVKSAPTKPAVDEFDDIAF